MVISRSGGSNASEVALTLVLMDTHYPNDVDRSLDETAPDKIRRYRPDYNNNPPVSPLYLLCLVRLGDYMVNLCAFYFYKLIGKMTAFLQLQEFTLRNMTVSTSTTVARRSPHISNPRLATFSLRLKHYGSSVNECFLIVTCKQLVWSTWIGRNMPI